jgi:N-methylhydantoinase A
VKPSARLAVDVGGTFTDVALRIDADVHTAKVLTNVQEPVRGALEAIDVALASARIRAEDVDTIIHGTTLATNALIERKGCKVAAVLTHGFRDILEIGYERRYDQYDLFMEKPDMIVPPEWCFTVVERIDAQGAVATELDVGSLDALVASLQDAGVDAAAVCLLHSYRNGDHEARVRDHLAARLPGVAVSLSSEVSPEIREYDRLCTTVANAYLTPLMSGYLEGLRRGLNEKSLRCPLLIINSGGSMTTVESSMRFPVRLIESGPSGGAVLASRIAAECGLDAAVSFDMGGTTAKICLIDDGQPQTTREFEVARAARFIRGSGLPIRIPVVQMIEIGAGGGSIAMVDDLGLITVGPRSAGSEPGPASYNRGGVDATVTDSDVALGMIDPGYFAEGRLELDRDLATDVLARDIGERMGVSTEIAAYGVSQVVDENMANAARIHAMERGASYAGRTMIAFGGNGSLHAARLATKLGVDRIIVPINPGVGSAVGFLDAPVAYETVRSMNTVLSRIDLGRVNALFAAMERDSFAVIQEALLGASTEVRRSAFMRYQGQGHEIEVPVPGGELGPDQIATLRTAYEREYARQYRRHVPGMEIEILNWAVVVSTPRRDYPTLASLDPTGRPEPECGRQIYHGESDSHLTVPGYRRGDLVSGDFIVGPALITEPQTTTFVPPGFDLAVDAASNLVMTRNPR